jgi:hypothetical protein
MANAAATRRMMGDSSARREAYPVGLKGGDVTHGKHERCNGDEYGHGNIPSIYAVPVASPA